MPTSKSIIENLIRKGIIPPEHRQDAVLELDRELKRRSLRVANKLARYASRQVLLFHLASVTAGSN